MNRLQKQALYNLVMIAGIFPFAALLTVMSLKIFGAALSVYLVVRNFAIPTFCIFIGVTKTSLGVFRMQKKDKEIYFDERDCLINYKAVLNAFYACYISLLVGFIFSSGSDENDSIPFYVLPLFFSSTAIFVMLAYSITILILYSWGDRDGE